MTVTLIVLVVVVIFAGVLMRATFGFGEAVVSMPLLAFLPISLPTSISLIGLVGLTVAGLTMRSHWRSIDMPALIWLAVATLLGIPVGLVLVTIAPAPLVTKTLGVLLILYAIVALVRLLRGQVSSISSWLAHRGWALPFGFAAGMLGSAYNLTGVPVVVYGTLRRWHPARFHGTLQAHFLIGGMLVVAGQGLGGFWTIPMFELYGISLPAILVATFLGMILHRRIPTEKFTPVVFLIIGVLGLLLLLNPR